MAGRLIIGLGVDKALGKTRSELEAMPVGEFLELAYYQGFDVRFRDRASLSHPGARISVTVDLEKRPILHAD